MWPPVNEDFCIWVSKYDFSNKQRLSDIPTFWGQGKVTDPPKQAQEAIADRDAPLQANTKAPVTERKRLESMPQLIRPI